MRDGNGQPDGFGEARREWEAPRLREHGSVSDLTKADDVGVNDSLGGAGGDGGAGFSIV